MKRIGRIIEAGKEYPASCEVEHVKVGDKNEYPGSLLLQSGTIPMELAARLERLGTMMFVEDGGFQWLLSVDKVGTDGFTFHGIPLSIP